MTEYKFEGNILHIDVPEDVLNHLAGIAITYKLLSKDRVTKAAKQQKSFFKGVLYGLQVGEVIDSDQYSSLYNFFMED